MKWIFVSIFLFLGIVPSAFAHGPGEQPYLKMNGAFTKLYPVYSTSVEDMLVPQDLAPEVYTVGQLIEFHIDEKMLPLPQEIIGKTTFLWDFGDGVKTDGLKSTHSYSKTGSYIMTLHVQYGDGEAQLMQATLIHIVPNKEYRIPTAVITVNGKTVNDPLVDTQRFPFSEPFTFDGSKSTSESEIVEYFWDFGDKQSFRTSGAKVTHTYNVEESEYGLPIVFPVLRVTTKDGFMADTYVQINNEDTEKESLSPQPQKSNKGNIGTIIVSGLGIVMMLTAISYFLVNNKKKKIKQSTDT